MARADGGAHERDDDEDAQQAVDDAGHGGQQINQEGNDVADFARGEFGQKDGAGKSQRHGDDQCDSGGDQRAVNKGRGAKIIEDRIPGARPEKHPAELGAGEMGSRSTTQSRAGR